MSIFDTIANTQVTEEVKQETIFTGGFTFAGGAYPTAIVMAYIEHPEFNGVVDKKLVVKMDYQVLIDGSPRKHQQTFYVTDDNGAVQFKDRNGKLTTSKGYKQVDAICQLAVGKPFSQLAAPQSKKVEVFGDIQDKDVFLDLSTVKFLGCFALETKSKMEKVTDSEGKITWEPTAETKTQNRLDVPLDITTGRTLYEKQHNIAADFLPKWKETYEGKEIDLTRKSKKSSGVKSGTPAKPSEGKGEGEGEGETKVLF